MTVQVDLKFSMYTKLKSISTESFVLASIMQTKEPFFRKTLLKSLALVAPFMVQRRLGIPTKRPSATSIPDVHVSL